MEKKRSDAGKPRGPHEKKDKGEGTLPDIRVGQERKDSIFKKVEPEENMKEFDEETGCYHIRGMDCINLIDEETFRDLLAEGVEGSARPTDDRTCGLCMSGMIVESLQTIIGNIPNFIPLIEIQKKDTKEVKENETE